MSTITKINLTVRGQYEKPPRQATLSVENWNEAERLRRALKWGGGAWIAAICLVTIPIVHFIAPPLLLISGPILFFRIRKQESVILPGQLDCPECGARTNTPRAQPIFPLETLCASCQSRLILTQD